MLRAQPSSTPWFSLKNSAKKSRRPAQGSQPGVWSVLSSTGPSRPSSKILGEAGVRLEVTGAEHLDPARGGAFPAVVVANHQSAIDPVVVASLLHGDFTVVAKKEARWDPRAVLGSVLLDPAFIDRSSSEKARATMAEVAERVRAGTSLLIFPEGTRSATPVPLPFKKGAFHLAAQARVDVVPVVLRNTGEVLPRHSKVIRPGVVQVRVLPPVPGWDAASRTRAHLDAKVADLHAVYERVLADWEGDVDA